MNELNIACDYEAVDLKTKKTETGKDFYSINPKGAVPTLQLDSGEILTENAVILQYIADTHHASQLLPPTTEFKRYRVLEWLNYITTEMHKGVGPLFNPAFPAEVKEAIVIPQLNGKLDYINRHLEKNHFLLGQSLTLPDPYLFVILRWLTFFNFDFNNWPHIARYWNELKSRPAITKSLDQEKLTRS